MGWSGGTYTKGNAATGGWTGDASLGIGIEAGRHDTQDNDFATGINQCLNKDGSNAATGNLNIGGYKVTNVAAGTARTDAAQVAQVQDGDYIWLGTTGGSATAQTATATPAISAYKAGQKFRMIVGAGLSSTGQSPTNHTININSLGAKQIVSAEGLNSSPTIGSWVAGALMELTYDGTYFRITNNPSGWQGWTPNLLGLAPNVINTQNYLRARFIKIGKLVHIIAWWSFGVTTGGGSVVQFNLPVKADDTVSPVAYTPNWAHSNDSSGVQLSYIYLLNSTTAYISKSTVWASGAAGSAEVRMSMSYEAA